MVHFRHFSAKIWPKNLKQHLIAGYALVQNLKKVFLTEKYQTSYAGFAQSCRKLKKP